MHISTQPFEIGKLAFPDYQNLPTEAAYLSNGCIITSAI
jgi:hypothetical protein